MPALRLAPPFARRIAEVAPAIAQDGNAAGAAELRIAAAAVATAGDLLGRLAANSSGHGRGLRGGRFTVTRTASAVHATLDSIRWTGDLAVSGTVDFRPGADDGEAALLKNIAAATTDTTAPSATPAASTPASAGA